jgi:hypothetical protein
VQAPPWQLRPGIIGKPFEPEKLTAYEIGIKSIDRSELWLDPGAHAAFLSTLFRDSPRRFAGLAALLKMTTRSR